MRNAIWADMLKLIDQGESFVTAAIVDKTGSAPRGAGARMIVRHDRRIMGTVGGGRLEAEAIAAAGDVFAARKPMLHEFRLTGEDAALSEMICGGAGEILLDYIDAGSAETRMILEGLLGSLTHSRKAWLITGIGTGRHNHGARQQCLVHPGGHITGSFACSQEFFLRMISGPAKLAIHSEVLEDQRIFIEPIHEGGTLYIFGAGHVSQKIAPVAELVGFRTVILDDRPEFANVQRFPQSQILLLDSLENELPDLELDGDSYLVIVTRGHLHDKRILEQVLKAPVAYIGMIGSRHKRDLVYKQIMLDHGGTAEEVGAVHCPIGLDILAESPEEIAVSIAAELIRVRAEKSRGRG